MYANPYCASCGALLKRDDPACPKCGTPRALAPEPAPALTGAEGAAAGNLTGTAPLLAPTVDYVLEREISRTKTGVGLLAVGAALGWIPVIGYLGGLLSLAGAILVILGREAFGDKHGRNVGIAIALFVVGLIGGVVLAGGILTSVTQAANLPPAEAEPVVVSAFDTLLAGAVVLSILTGPASVLFLWELLGVPGKVLILLSYVAGILIALWVYLVITGQVAAALSSAFAVTPPDTAPLLALDAQMNGLRLLDAIPSLLAAGAAGMAWSRVASGVIPED